MNNELLNHLDEIHTTKLGVERIQKNLSINEDVVIYIKNKIIKKDAKIYQKGKNYYCEIDNIIVTINSYNYSIITAHVKKRELRDLYDKDGNKTNLTYYKGDSIPKGYYPMVVMVVIRNSEGKFLMQKRAPSKGGDWGVTGGHPKSGETPIEGIINEVKEELGLDFLKKEFILYDSGCDGKDCYKMYFVNKDIDIKDIKIQKEELSEVRWFTMAELKYMVKTHELNNDQIACFNKVCDYLSKHN